MIDLVLEIYDYTQIPIFIFAPQRQRAEMSCNFLSAPKMRISVLSLFGRKKFSDVHRIILMMHRVGEYMGSTGGHQETGMCIDVNHLHSYGDLFCVSV